MSYKELPSVRTLVIPDVHNKVFDASAIVEMYPDIEQRVFLGDVYDSKGKYPKDTFAQASHTARWHAEMLEDPRNIFLMGNHDAPYRWPSVGDLMCSGYSSAKQGIIERTMTRKMWDKVLLSVQVSGVTLSHAGWNSINLYECDGDLECACSRAVESLNAGYMDDLLGAGRCRGGDLPLGGITWLDWDNEFADVPGMRQIVGHTRGKLARRLHDNYCIDTGLIHHAIIEVDGKVRIITSDGTELNMETQGENESCQGTSEDRN